jgi:hypothetical protein
MRDLGQEKQFLCWPKLSIFLYFSLKLYKRRRLQQWPEEELQQPPLQQLGELQLASLQARSVSSLVRDAQLHSNVLQLEHVRQVRESKY